MWRDMRRKLTRLVEFHRPNENARKGGDLRSGKTIDRRDMLERLIGMVIYPLVELKLVD